MTTPHTSVSTTHARRSRRHAGLLLAGVVLAVLAAGPGRPTRTVHAFDLDSHEAILRTALTTVMSKDALDEVTNYGIAVPAAGQKSEISSISLAPGAALHALQFEQLWDNAATATAICERLASVTGVLQYALEQAAPKGAQYRELTDDKKARRAFGLAAVLLSNFYAHSNWVELAADSGAMPVVAPLTEACSAQTLPSDLQTGYYDAASGPDGCPKAAGAAKPPAPYKFCFAQLSKDASDSGHGAQRATKLAGQPTYYELAKQLAVEATKQLFTGFHSLVVQTYTPESWNANGQCVFDKLTRASGDPDNPFGNTNVGFKSDASCLDLSGVWQVGSAVDTGGPSTSEIGSIVTIQQQRSLGSDQLHLYAYFKSPGDGADCDLGSTRSYFFDATLDGVKITGTTSQCLEDARVLAYCGQTSVYEVEFAGSLDGDGRVRTITGTFTDTGYALHLEDDIIVSCEAYPPFDEVYDFRLKRKPAPAP